MDPEEEARLLHELAEHWVEDNPQPAEGAAKAPERCLYDARVVDIVDGDTIDVVMRRRFDMGFGMELEGVFTARLRLADLNAPEVHGEEKPLGEVSTIAVSGWLQNALSQANGNPWPLIVEACERDSFGRALAKVWMAPSTWGRSLNQWLVDQGYAKPFRVGEAGI